MKPRLQIQAGIAWLRAQSKLTLVLIVSVVSLVFITLFAVTIGYTYGIAVLGTVVAVCAFILILIAGGLVIGSRTWKKVQMRQEREQLESERHGREQRGQPGVRQPEKPPENIPLKNRLLGWLGWSLAVLAAVMVLMAIFTEHLAPVWDAFGWKQKKLSYAFNWWYFFICFLIIVRALAVGWDRLRWTAFLIFVTGIYILLTFSPGGVSKRNVPFPTVEAEIAARREAHASALPATMPQIIYVQPPERNMDKLLRNQARDAAVTETFVIPSAPAWSETLTRRTYAEYISWVMMTPVIPPEGIPSRGRDSDAEPWTNFTLRKDGGMDFLQTQHQSSTRVSYRVRYKRYTVPTN